MPAPYMFKKTSTFIENSDLQLFYNDRQIIGTEILGKSVAEEQPSNRFIARYQNVAGYYDWTWVLVQPDLTFEVVAHQEAEDESTFLEFLNELPENMRITNIDFGAYTELNDLWNA